MVCDNVLTLLLRPQNFTYWVLLLGAFLSGGEPRVVKEKAYFLGQSFLGFVAHHHMGAWCLCRAFSGV